MNNLNTIEPNRIGNPISLAIKCSLFCWGLILVAGTLVLANYTSSPGSPLEAKPHSTTFDLWPSDSTIVAHAEQPTLLVFVHPKCPCSRASVRELMLALANPDLDVNIVSLFYCPKEEQAVWAHTDLWSSMEQIPNCTPRVDHDGNEAAKFGAMTSGHVMFFDTNGHRTFSGGITCGRGHEGNNPARQALTEILNGQKVRQIDFPVFGCSLISKANTRNDS
jgi:hypothetical protein